MKNKIRKFAFLIVDDFDRELVRLPLDYVDTPRGLGFELEFTTLESRLTTYFTSAREKKVPKTLNLYFLNPDAYAKANTFKRIVQANMNKKMVLEYNDTDEIIYKFYYYTNEKYAVSTDENVYFSIDKYLVNQIKNN
jgi:hypothetical protein